MKKYKVLIVSELGFNKTNSFGNTYLKIFEGLNVEYIVIRRSMHLDDQIDNLKIFQITEMQMLKSIVSRTKVGQLIEGLVAKEKILEKNRKILGWLKILKSSRSVVLNWTRDVLWKTGLWKNNDLDSFIIENAPDIIFQPVGLKSPTNDIVDYIVNKFDIPMCGYVSDDCYTLKKFSYSILFWADYLYKRRLAKRTINQCKILYVISSLQKQEYDELFSIESKVLTKSNYYTDHKVNILEKSSNEIKILYAGVITPGRYKTLLLICNTLNELAFTHVSLDIYTTTHLPQQKVNRLATNLNVKFHGAKDYLYIEKKIIEADVVLHVEGFDRQELSNARLSFSTKLVDYFYFGKTILAVGPSEIASMQHLKMTESAICVCDLEAINAELSRAILSPHTRNQVAKNAFSAGINCHNKHKFNNMLMEDFKCITR